MSAANDYERRRATFEAQLRAQMGVKRDFSAGGYAPGSSDPFSNAYTSDDEIRRRAEAFGPRDTVTRMRDHFSSLEIAALRLHSITAVKRGKVWVVA